MTTNQLATYRNHNGNAAQYDMISIFSLRPPELLHVFQNPIIYFRLCYIVEENISVETIESGLSDDINSCRWIDCLGRHVKLRSSGLNEIAAIVEKNLSSYDDEETLIEEEIFSRNMNYFILDIIAAYDSSIQGDTSENFEQTERIKKDFIHHDDSDLLPIPVISNTTPENTIHFLIHIILSMGEYETEIDALCHSSFRSCFRETRIIGNETDEDSLKRFSELLTRRYIEDEVVYLPNSMNRSETFIVMAKRIFDDSIIHNEISINELPPFSMNSLRVQKSAENERFWRANVESQVESIYSMLQEKENYPIKDEILEVTRELPMNWDLISSFSQYENQSVESFEEQKKALQLNINNINKYTSTNGHESTTYTKNVVTYGAPGTGKSFIGQLVVLYCLTKGLNVLSTSLMGVRANSLGGLHIHKLFMLPTNDALLSKPFLCAQYAIEKIKRCTHRLHALLSLDVIFFDELAQLSAEQLSAIDIILRYLRKSQIPFGGVLILGTMDHTQIQPINLLPFLTSSLVLTSFVAVKLQHSVRAHGDIDFQRLQSITRMNPFELRNDSSLKQEFFDLAGSILTFVPDWNDSRISPNMMRAFSRIRPAQEALNEYRECIKRQLENDNIPFRLSRSRDMHRTQSTNAEYSIATPQSIKTLNKELKEPSEIIFFAGGIYECTINDLRGRYNQSQLAFMLDIPSQESVDRFEAIKMWIAPAGTHYISFERDNIPSRASLLDLGWNEVQIGCAAERIIVARGGLQAKRLQYSLKHIGAITINKSQGETLPLGLAVEITKKYSPWQKGQIVVLLSRTTTARNTLIVGNKNFAVQKMWELITIGTQWTLFTNHILDLISYNETQQMENPQFLTILMHIHSD